MILRCWTAIEEITRLQRADNTVSIWSYKWRMKLNETKIVQFNFLKKDRSYTTVLE